MDEPVFEPAPQNQDRGRLMTFDPNDGAPLPDSSRIQETTVGELADWLAENPPQGCGCENPEPYQLCCPARLIYDTPRGLRGAPRRQRPWPDLSSKSPAPTGCEWSESEMWIHRQPHTCPTRARGRR